jgi:hypothetical protein
MFRHLFLADHLQKQGLVGFYSKFQGSFFIIATKLLAVRKI